jgi:hypothetical protein
MNRSWGHTSVHYARGDHSARSKGCKFLGERGSEIIVEVGVREDGDDARGRFAGNSAGGASATATARLEGQYCQTGNP